LADLIAAVLVGAARCTVWYAAASSAGIATSCKGARRVAVLVDVVALRGYDRLAGAREVPHLFTTEGVLFAHRCAAHFFVA
jgi:hypothetical protein